jgi:hypothetical protein
MHVYIIFCENFDFNLTKKIKVTIKANIVAAAAASQDKEKTGVGNLEFKPMFVA